MVGLEKLMDAHTSGVLAGLKLEMYNKEMFLIPIYNVNHDNRTPLIPPPPPPSSATPALLLLDQPAL